MFNKIFNRLAFMATFIAASVGMSATTIAGGHQVVGFNTLFNSSWRRRWLGWYSKRYW